MGKEQDLLDAARTGNVVTIQKILSARPKNALSQAIAIGFRRSVAPNCQDSSGYTPMHHAVLNGHRLAVEILLKYDASPGMPDAKGSTPFHLAAWTGGTEIIRVLISHARAYCHINGQNNDWDTPLHFAAQYGHTDVVKLLLENAADPTIVNKKEEMPLDLAAQYGRLETVQLLLGRQPELLGRIPDHRSILHLAARNGHPEVIKALLAAGCDINKKLKTGSALHEAALFGKVEAVRVLLEHSPAINYRMKDSASETALQKVEGYPSKVAIEIAAMIKAHIRGDPLPPSTATPGPLRKAKELIDAEQQSTYDNVPPATAPDLPAGRHSSYTPPLVKKPARPFRPMAGAGRSANYMNVDLPAKVPPKKPARSSIGILLDKVDLSASPKAESPLVNSTCSMYDLSSAPLGSSSPASQPKSSDSEKSPPPLPDRNYYDEDVAGEYTQLRLDATKATVSASPSVPIKSTGSSFKCSAPPPTTVPPEPAVLMRASSRKKRHIYAPDPIDDDPVISSKEDVNEVRKSLVLLDHPPLLAQAPDPIPGPGPMPSSSESESFYEDLSEAYSGEVVTMQQVQSSTAPLQHLQIPAHCNSTMGSSTGSDTDADVYELLSDATTGQHENYNIPPPTRVALSSVGSALEDLSPTSINPVPPPRRSKHQAASPRSSTPTLPMPSINNDLNGSLPTLATSSYYSDLQSSETADSDVPSSPGSCYSQPPTPDHPPPSPHTAMLGIQAKLSPQSFPRGNLLGGQEPSNQAWTSQRASVEEGSAFRPIGCRDPADSSEQASRFLETRHCLAPESSVFYSTGTNYSLADPSSGFDDRSEERQSGRRLNRPEKPSRFGFPRTGIGATPQTHFTDDSHPGPVDLHQTETGRGPVNGSHSLTHSSIADSEGYQANDEFQSITDTSSSGDTELLRQDEEDPFAGPAHRIQGLIYGSNRGSRNLSLETTSRFSLSQHMTDWSLAGSSRTSMVGENGPADAPPDGGGGGGHGGGTEDGAGAIDENSEWAQIESIMASFGAGLVRESVYIRDFQKEFEKMFEGPTKPQSVGAWLESLGMGQYENMLIANGFDNLDFMGGNILEESDLTEMGILEELHRKIILQATSALPVMKTITQEGNMPSSVSEWLRSLLLSDCIPNFLSNGITSMERAMELWELELETVLEVHLLGHRKRILASLGERRHSVGSSSNSSIPRPDSLELTTDDLELKLSSFERRKQLSSITSEQSASLDIDLFKDYSKEVTTPNKPKPLPGFSAQDSTPLANAQASAVAAMQHSDIEDYDNMATSDRMTASTSCRASDAKEAENGPTSPPVQWMHPPEALIKGCCNYTASYLGSTLVKEAKGTDSTQESCTKLRRSASHLHKVPSITLSISYLGVKFIDFKSKMVITEHEICNISCVTQDSDDLRTFAYITKDSENDKLYCHVFSVKAEDIAAEIIMTLGQAFEIAYQMLLKSRPGSTEHTRLLSNTSENDHETRL
ncbi:ankyrin repeat and SAM domain-containing protein 1A-like isoform X2 [Acanthaster planci]|uniref:Ankyrin repeat and SAM domain-containing protein 1A-like isoform X2 n=1 Tax=Acanthaster planci TaxID=133434 RepID=A0A8B7Y7L2_ACAPL|nr:ankyrin repeat and SAM domain-containing protein 1A-like isoform X2 [Acanthaster planci]